MDDHSLNLTSADSQYAYITDANQTGLNWGSGDGTVGAWFWLKSTGVDQCIVIKGAGGVGEKRYLLFVTSGDNIRFDLDDDGASGLKSVVGTTTLVAGKWYYATGVRDGNNLRVYLNGVEDATATDITGYGSVDSTRDFQIGASNTSGTVNLFFDGIIKDVRVYSDARTREEIQSDMVSKPTGSEDNAQGIWLLDNGYTDLTANGNDLTASGSPTFLQFAPHSFENLNTTDWSIHKLTIDNTKVSSEVYGSNLLTNGGFETGDLTGWTTTGDAVVRSYSVRTGTYSLGYGLDSYTASQTVDVSSYADEIDMGNLEATIVGWARNGGIAEGDTLRIRLQYLDSDNNILAENDSGTIAGSSTWTEYTDTRTCPFGTRKLKIDFTGTEGGTTNADLYLDDCSITIKKTAHTNYPVTIADDNLISDLYSNIQSVNRYSLDLELSSSQYAYIADNANLSITGDITIEALIKFEQLPSVAGSSMVIVAKDDVSLQANRSYGLNVLSATDKMRFVFSDTAGNSYADCDTAFTEVGRWYHVAVAVDVSVPSFTFYIDGVAQTETVVSSTVTSINDSTTDFIIGARINGASKEQYFDGQIKDVRIWNDVRTENEIIENMYKSTPASTTNLVGHWRFENDYTDESGNGNTLTAVNAPTFVENVPFVAQDLRFTSDEAGTTELPFEVVYMDTGSSVAEIHVKLPTVSYNTDTTFYVWYNNSSARAYAKTDWFGQYRVWSDNSSLIDHTQYNSIDSTVNENDGSDTGVTYLAANGNIQTGAGFANSTPTTSAISYISVADDSTLSPGTGNFAISLWFKTSDTRTGNRFMLSHYDSVNTNNYYSLYLDTNQYLSAAYRDTDGDSVAQANSTALNDGAWHHVVWVRNGTSGSLYLDGSLVGTNTNALLGDINTNNGDPLWIGAYGVSSVGQEAQSYSGSLDEIRIIKTDLSADWIATEYNNQSSPSTFITGASLGRRIFIAG